MGQKRQRKHAAEVFREQNMLQEIEEAGEIADNFADLEFDANETPLTASRSEGNIYGGPAAPPEPSPAQQIQMNVPISPPRPMPQSASAPIESKKVGARPPMEIQPFKTSEELQLETEPLRVRETGIWMWKRIIVPPNAYVVHTRMGHKNPVTLGLGVSFHYNPRTDAYMVVPAAMQTIGVVANCISREKQGINVLAYVQWQIADFSVAYRKLDFSDQRDPLGIVNAQLREQAEAAIKDKIATMTVEDVLTDKEPVIEELTTRLKAVAEGRTQNAQETEEGLGIKIVTVQIKEALVSSKRLWDDLQAPFRHEKRKSARISHLEAEEEIRQKELDTHRVKQTSEAETQLEIERAQQEKETEAHQIRQQQALTRFNREQQTDREKTQLQEETTLSQRESEARLEAQRVQAEHDSKIEQARLEAEVFDQEKIYHIEKMLADIREDNRLEELRVEIRRQQLERNTEIQRLQSEYDLLIQAQADQMENNRLSASLGRERQTELAAIELEETRLSLREKEVEIERLQQENRNLTRELEVATALIEQLPQIAESLPDIHELRVFQSDVDGYNQLASFMTQIRSLFDSVRTVSNGHSPSENGTAPG